MTYAVNEDGITIFDTATGNAVCVCGPVNDGSRELVVFCQERLMAHMEAVGQRDPARELLTALGLVEMANRITAYLARQSALTFPDEQVQRAFAVLIAHLLNEGAK